MSSKPIEPAARDTPAAVLLTWVPPKIEEQPLTDLTAGLSTGETYDNNLDTYMN